MSGRPDVARQWMIRAAKNLAHAKDSLGDDSAPEVECYYAQQAAEMAVKAVHIARGIPHARTHNIGKLLENLERNGVCIPPEVDAANGLGGYATESRYHEENLPVFTDEHRAEAARVANIVLEWAKTEIARTE